METWFVIVMISLCICLRLKSKLSNIVFRVPATSLPPGPIKFPIVGNIFWLRASFVELLEPTLRNLHAKYGPIVALHIGPRPAIFIRNRSLVHQALVQNGAVFADRPPALSGHQHNISSSSYGSTWRLLRRNLSSEILHPQRLKSYFRSRKRVLEILITSLQSESIKPEPKPVLVKDHLRHAVFSSLAWMCFGDNLEEKQIKEIEAVQRRLLWGFGRFNVLSIALGFGLTKILFRKRWEEFLHLLKDQERVLVPLINARKTKKPPDNEEEVVKSYVGTLLGLEQQRPESQIVSLCSEFLNAGTDTTSTALEWIMANLVKYPRIQERLLEEIKGVVGTDNNGGDDEEEVIKEEDLQRMAYLKAVVLEGLRRHPPGRFLLPHAVTEDVVLEGHLVPKHATVNSMVADIGCDPNVWERPMDFEPERFMRESSGGGGFETRGSREIITMMPFGLGRRICPGSALAMLLLQYFVANLVWKFEWTAADDEEVDLSEKQEFTMVMKNPLKACISARLNR